MDEEMVALAQDFLMVGRLSWSEFFEMDEDLRECFVKAAVNLQAMTSAMTGKASQSIHNAMMIASIADDGDTACQEACDQMADIIQITRSA